MSYQLPYVTRSDETGDRLQVKATVREWMALPTAELQALLEALCDKALWGQYRRAPGTPKARSLVQMMQELSAYIQDRCYES